MTHDPDYIDDGAEILLGILFLAAVGAGIWSVWDAGALLPLLGVLLGFIGVIIGIAALMYALGWMANELPPRIMRWFGR